MGVWGIRKRKGRVMRREHRDFIDEDDIWSGSTRDKHRNVGGLVRGYRYGLTSNMTSQAEVATAPSQPTSDIIPPSSDAPAPSSPSPVKISQPDTSTPGPTNPRLAALATKRATLEQTLSDLQAQRSAIVAKATLPSGLAMPAEWNEDQRTKQALSGAQAIIKEHIALLHKYNEMKDIGQGLMGLIAEQRGVRVSEVMEDFDMGRKD